MIKLFLWIYVRLIRPFTSRFIYFSLRPFVKIEVRKWNKLKNLFIEDFSKEVDKIQYHFDPIGGILDFTIYNPDMYFDTIGYGSMWIGRDCDDAAHIWHLYCKHHNYEHKIVAVINGCNVKKSHFFVVIKIEDGKYKYANYALSKEKYDSYSDAINAVCKGMLYDKPIYIKF